jgi:threonylcarbamoyladenosine tRNA methylthiotransferase MtaB
MNRHYTPDMYLEAVSMLRGKFPEAGITTDIIVGLPGEGEEEFLETFDFCRKIAFSKIHVFPYSKRPGTRAAELPDQVDSSVKRDRAGRMLALSDELSQAFHAQYIGKDVEILVEKSTADRIEGLTANYIRVFANSKSDDLYNSPHIYKSYFQNNIQGAYAAVHITDAKPSHILGTIL